MKEIEKYLGGRSIFTHFWATKDLLWPKGQTKLYWEGRQASIE